MTDLKFNQLDSIIFDLDGTLWDSSEVVFEAWQETLGQAEEVKESVTREMLETFIGIQLHEIGEIFLDYLPEERRIEILKSCCRLEIDRLRQEGGELFPELEDTLKVLSEKYKLFIVSNCESGYIEAFFEYHGLGKYFKDFECPGNTGLPKAENIKLIIQRNNLKNSVYVGDTQGDFDSARKAGIPFIYARYGFGKVEEYEHGIDNISDLMVLE
jgi:phosphoglycolate phosphatase